LLDGLICVDPNEVGVVNSYELGSVRTKSFPLDRAKNDVSVPAQSVFDRLLLVINKVSESVLLKHSREVGSVDIRREICPLKGNKMHEEKEMCHWARRKMQRYVRSLEEQRRRKKKGLLLNRRAKFKETEKLFRNARSGNS